MFINWLLTKDIKDPDNLLIKSAAIVLFAGSVLLINELWFWQSSVLILSGVSVFAGTVGFFVAKRFPIAIKAIPLVVVFFLASTGAKELYDHFLFKTKFIEPFLAKTDNCKALGLELVNKHTVAACLPKDSKTIKGCQHVTDNQWSCPVMSWSDVVASASGHVKAFPHSDVP